MFNDSLGGCVFGCVFFLSGGGGGGGHIILIHNIAQPTLVRFVCEALSDEWKTLL